MATLDSRRYGIAEVSQMTGVSLHILRQWEQRFPQLRPKRDRANRRYYTAEDVDIVWRIKELLRNEKMTTEGARKRLTQELKGEGRPKTRTQMLEYLDKIEAEIAALLKRLDEE